MHRTGYSTARRVINPAALPGQARTHAPAAAGASLDLDPEHSLQTLRPLPLFQRNNNGAVCDR
jgi:hypothetical protein